MDNIKKWCANKENLKILFMIAMAIVLVFVLKHRFSRSDSGRADASPAPYENKAEPQETVAQGTYDPGFPVKSRPPSKVAAIRRPAPPPFLKRDIFAAVNSVHIPSGRAAKVEEADLELTATIIDGTGAVAIIGNEVLAIGDRIRGMRVTSIQKNSVVLSGGQRNYTLRLKED